MWYICRVIVGHFRSSQERAMREPIRRVSGFVIPMYAILSLAAPAAAQVDQQRAAMYFNEAAAICERDGARLWGVSLCGPMVFADMRTQTMATSQSPPAGKPPKSLGFVNGPIEWGGGRGLRTSGTSSHPSLIVRCAVS